MEFPLDKESMYHFLGMVNFLNRYSPRLVELSTSLRQFCRLHADYKPESEHYQSFNAIKKELSTKTVLPYYDPASHTTLQTDSSKKGLGAVLIQSGTPIYFASRAISSTECNYQNLECETLRTIWGVEKFHYFLYGNKFMLETDQKPVVSIYWKHLVDVSHRIQRLIVRALPYNFHVVYVTAKQIPMADALSRNLKFPFKNREEMVEEDQISLPILAVNYITGNYQQHPDKPVMDWIREETSKDATLQLLKKYIRNGGLKIERNFQRNCTLTWITEMNFPWRMKSYEVIQNSNTIHHVNENVRSNPWRTPRNWEVFAAFQRIPLLAWNFWWNLLNSKQVWNLSSYIHSTEETSQCSKWNYTTCLAHPRHWFVLLETLWFLSSRRLLFKISDCEETSKFCCL